MQRMQKYVDQLIADLAAAKPAFSPLNYELSFGGGEDDDHGWLQEMEEIDLAPRKMLHEWTGIQQVQLPPDHMLTDQELEDLLVALLDLLHSFNLMAAFHTALPERKQYMAIRHFWDQEVPFLKHSTYYLQYCDHDKKNCILGSQDCQCAFLEKYMAQSFDFEDELDDMDDDLRWKNDPRHRDTGWDSPDF